MTIDYYGQTAEYNTKHQMHLFQWAAAASEEQEDIDHSDESQSLGNIYASYSYQVFISAVIIISSHFLAWPTSPLCATLYTLPTMTNIRYAVGLPLNNPLCHQLKHQLTSCEAAALTSTANTRKPCQTNPDGDTEQIWIPEVSSVPLYNYPKNTPQP